MEQGPVNDSSPGAIVLLVIVTLLALFPVCRNDFVLWDDSHNFARDDALARVPPAAVSLFWRHPQKDLYIPVTYTLWWTVGTLLPRTDGSLSPHVFHTLNLVIHVFSVLAAFGLLRRLRFSQWAACLGAMVFAVHPVQVESVAWASATKDLLAGLFTILALLSYLNWLDQRASGRTSSVVALAAATLAFLLAMLSKPSAVSMPALAAIATWLAMRDPADSDITNRRARLLPTACVIGFWILLALPFIWMAHYAQPAASVQTAPLFRPVVALDALAFYTKQILAPFSLAMDYGRSPHWLSSSPQRFWSWIIPVAIALATLALPRRWLSLKLGVLFLVIAPFPTLGFVSFDFQSYSTVADHYLYVGMLGAGMAVAALVSIASRPLTCIILALCIVLLAFRSHAQSRIWRNSETLFRHTLVVNPQSVAAAVNLGKIRADEADAFKATGRLNEAMTRSDEAISLYKRALASSPDDADAHRNLGNMYKLQQRWPEAESQYRAVLDALPEDAETHVQLGVVLGNQLRVAEAADEFREAVRIAPDYVVARALLEQALRMTPQTRPVTP